MEAGQLFTWDSLLSMGGASLATFLFVQMTKTFVDRIAQGLPTDVYAALVAFTILTLAQLATGADGTDWRLYVLSFLNGLLVWATAGKIQNVAINPPMYRKKGAGINERN